MEINNQFEILQYLIDSGKIDLSNAEEEMKKEKLNKILGEHPYAITQGANGRWMTYVYDETFAKNRRKIAKSSLDKIHEALYDHYTGKDKEKQLQMITLEKLFPQWIEHKSLYTEAVTYIQRIKSEWKRYYEGTPITKVAIKSLTKLRLEEWAHSLIKEHSMTKNQYYNCTVIMRQSLDYAMDLGIIQGNPFEKVSVNGKRMFRHPKKPSNETQVYSKAELEAIREMAYRDFEEQVKVYQLSPLAVLFQFQTGVRIGELCVLKYSDLDDNYLTVQRMIRRDTGEIVEHTKGNSSERKVILTSEAKKIIELCKQRQENLKDTDEEYIFSVNGEPCSYYAISDLYRKYCKKLGIVQKSSHKSRKTAISTMIDGNLNINTVREMVGHSDERTTYKNYCFDRSTADERIEQMERAFS